MRECHAQRASASVHANWRPIWRNIGRQMFYVPDGHISKSGLVGTGLRWICALEVSLLAVEAEGER